MHRTQTEIRDDCCEILAATNDGNSLSGGHLHLIQLCVNGSAREAGLEELDRILTMVRNEGYTRPWFYGVEGLTKDPEGYVYWKGRHVEHFSFREREKEKAAAESLGYRCRHLEDIGAEVTTGNVVFYWEHFIPSTEALLTRALLTRA